MRKMYDRMERSAYYRTEEAKDEMMAGSYAFVTNDMHANEYLHGEDTTQKQVCALTEIYLPVEDIKLSQYVAKDSGYKRIMDYQ